MKITEKTNWKVSYEDIDTDAGCDDPKPYITDETGAFVAETYPEYAIYLGSVPKLILAIQNIISSYDNKETNSLDKSVEEAAEILSWIESETEQCIEAGKEISAFRRELIKNKPLRMKFGDMQDFAKVYPEIEAKYEAWRKKLVGKWLLP